MKVEYIVLLVSMLREDVLTTQPLFAPSFISDWRVAKARNKSMSLVEINHGLGQYPAKVDVQIKIRVNGEDNIFTGVGSAQRDDDLNYKYGGFVYKYNKTHVLLSAPFANNNADKSGIAYTGSPDIYTGPSRPGTSLYLDGHVRVRIWLESDMPELVFNSSIYMSDDKQLHILIQSGIHLPIIGYYNIYITSNPAEDNYKDIQHKLGYYPDIVTVQVLTNDGFMSEGQGTTSMLTTTDNKYNGLGGVIFGYDFNNISLWTPSSGHISGNVGVFYAVDGWSLGVKSSGTVYVKAWTFDCSQVVYKKKIKVGKYLTDVQTPFLFPCIYNISQYLLSVQVQESTGHNNGMIFYGAGSTMATGVHGYGGVLYVYNSEKVMIWRPADSNNNGDIINIGGRWGSGQVTKRSDVAELIIRVFYLVPQECPRSGNVGNASYTVNNYRIGGVISYSCNNGYKYFGGNISRFCQRNRTWSGVPPMCLDDNWCTNLSHVINASINSHDNRIGGHISYSCKIGYHHKGGNLQRYCLSNQTWSGSSPTCVLYSGFDFENYRIDKRNTSKYYRSLISIWEDRTSVLVIGGISCLVIIIPMCACILPDIYTMWRHATDYASIYQGQRTENKISADKSQKCAKDLSDGNESSGKEKESNNDATPNSHNDATPNSHNVKKQRLRRKQSKDNRKGREKSWPTLMQSW